MMLLIWLSATLYGGEDLRPMMDRAFPPHVVPIPTRET